MNIALALTLVSQPVLLSQLPKCNDAAGSYSYVSIPAIKRSQAQSDMAQALRDSGGGSQATCIGGDNSTKTIGFALNSNHAFRELPRKLRAMGYSPGIHYR
jgi:hypothetical protein